jgi:hypothetical protein
MTQLTDAELSDLSNLLKIDPDLEIVGPLSTGGG